MKPTKLNEIKLWWHCLWTLHRPCRLGSLLDVSITHAIGCKDCNFGECRDIKFYKEWNNPNS